MQGKHLECKAEEVFCLFAPNCATCGMSIHILETVLFSHFWEMQVILDEVGCETNKVLCVHLHPLTAQLVNGPCPPAGNRECPPINKASLQLPPIKIKMGRWTNSWKSKPFQFIFLFHLLFHLLLNTGSKARFL